MLESKVDGADETAVAEVMAAIADRVVHDMGKPYNFPSTHRRILQPYDYYAFGQARHNLSRIASGLQAQQEMYSISPSVPGTGGACTGLQMA